MQQDRLLPFPETASDLVSRDLVEIDAAIGLVSRGFATRVCLVGLQRPQAVAASGLAHAQAALIAFSIDRDPAGRIAITIGPRS